MKYLKNTLFILLCAASIGLAGCGNSAGAAKDRGKNDLWGGAVCCHRK